MEQNHLCRSSSWSNYTYYLCEIRFIPWYTKMKVKPCFMHQMARVSNPCHILFYWLMKQDHSCCFSTPWKVRYNITPYLNKPTNNFITATSHDSPCIQSLSITYICKDGLYVYISFSVYIRLQWIMKHMLKMWIMTWQVQSSTSSKKMSVQQWSKLLLHSIPRDPITLSDDD